MQEPPINRLQKLTEALETTPARLNTNYSSSIRKLRIALPIIAAVLVVAIFWSGQSRNYTPVPRSQILSEPQGQTELLNPRFESADNDKQPFTITAKKAVQDQAEPDLVHLEKPVADMTSKDGTWVAIEADQGLFYQENRILHLSGGVRLFHDTGYELTSKEADIDMFKQTAITKGAVSGRGPMGTIEATKLHANGNTGIMIFDGPATLVLNKKTTP